MVRATFSLFLAMALFATAPHAHAQFDLTEEQSESWYGTQITLLSVMTLGSLAALTDAEAISAPRLRRAPAFEKGTEENLSPFSSRVSDVTVLTAVGLPAGSLYFGRKGASYQNSLLIHGQAMTSSLLVNTVTKQLVLRARPYTHQKNGRTGQADDNYSFYSGHSALAFTSVTSSSLLFSAVENDSGLRSAHWAASFALASFTAHARVRAGKHYPTDVFVGSLMGIGFGWLTPALHGVDVTPSPRDLASASTGLVAGSLLAFLLPRRVSSSIALQAQMIPTPTGLTLASSAHF